MTKQTVKYWSYHTMALRLSELD